MGKYCTCLCKCKNSLETDDSDFEFVSVYMMMAELEDLSDEQRKKLMTKRTICEQCENGFHVTRFE